LKTSLPETCSGTTIPIKSIAHLL